MNGFDDFDAQYQCEDVYQEDAMSFEWAEDVTDEPPMYSDFDGFEYPEFDS